MVCPGNSDVRRKLLHTAGFVTWLHQKHSHRGQESNPRPRVWRRRRLKRRQVQKCARGCRMCLVPLIHRQPGLLERHKNARCRSVRGYMGRTVGGAISIQPATQHRYASHVCAALAAATSRSRARDFTGACSAGCSLPLMTRAHCLLHRGWLQALQLSREARQAVYAPTRSQQQRPSGGWLLAKKKMQRKSRRKIFPQFRVV